MRARTVLGALFAGCALLSCGEAPEPSPPPSATHGAVVFEPPALRVGELVKIDVVVVTAPDHHVPPIEFPKEIPPLWLLDAERRPVQRDGGRWTHTTQVRARVRDVPGEYEWPAREIAVEGPGGETSTLRLEARPFVVVSASDALPDQLVPFGLRDAPESAPRGRLPAWGSAAAGSLATLIALAGWRFLRRRRARAAGAGEAEDTTPAWERAEQELRRALAEAEADPREAADAAALALRRYAAIRSARPLESLTTEEIAARRPPGRLLSHWPEFVALLRRLDALRFPGGVDEPASREALRAWFQDALAFVARSVRPRET